MTVDEAIRHLRDTALLGYDGEEQDLIEAINVLDNADVFVGIDGES